jgi:Glycosyl transferase family 2
MSSPSDPPRQSASRPVHLSDVPLVSEAAQEAFFVAALAHAQAAEAGMGAVERWFEVAGANLRVSFAGEALVEHLVPALAHLEIVPAADADATLHVWDSESTGIAMVAPLSPKTHFTKRGDIWSMLSPRFKSACSTAEAAVALMDVEQDIGVYWAESAAALPSSARLHPLLSLIHWWVERRGCQVMQGAALGAQGGGILIAGGAAAEQALALRAGLDAGLDFLAEEYLVAEPGPPPRLHTLYGKIGTGTMARSLGLKAIVMPVAVVRQESALTPIGKWPMARAAGFASLTQLPHAGRQTLDFVERLVTGLPAFRLELGTDLAPIPAVMTSILSGASMPSALASAGAPPVLRPLVSVIVPVRNGASFLPEAIASIRAQHYPAIEIIVVDDGSIDDIQDALRRLPGSIRYVRREAAGPSAARNRGIRESAGELIAFLDVDDLWPAENLGLMVDAFRESPPCDVVQGYPQIMRQMPETGGYAFVGNPLEVFPDYLGGALYRRSVFDRVGVLDESLNYFEDVDWFYRARDAGLAIRRLRQISLFVRRHGENLTHGGTERRLSFLALHKMMKGKRRRDSGTGRQQASPMRPGP